MTPQICPHCHSRAHFTGCPHDDEGDRCLEHPTLLTTPEDCPACYVVDRWVTERSAYGVPYTPPLSLREAFVEWIVESAGEDADTCAELSRRLRHLADRPGVVSEWMNCDLPRMFWYVPVFRVCSKCPPGLEPTVWVGADAEPYKEPFIVTHGLCDPHAEGGT